jgi:hypothetical protein
MSFTIAAALLAAAPPASDAPPPIIAGPLIPIPNEPTDDQLAQSLLADLQLKGTIGEALGRTNLAAEAFVRLGLRGGCLAWQAALDGAVQRHSGPWRAAMVRSLRAVVPANVVVQYARSGISQGDALLLPYRERILQVLIEAGGQGIVDATYADAADRVAEAAATASGNLPDRAVRLAAFQEFRGRSRDLCSLMPQEN